jgi:hypothetical protein
MFDLTYLLGMLKNVATGVGGRGGENRAIGGSTRLASILEINDELADLMNVFERDGVHCSINTKELTRTKLRAF